MENNNIFEPLIDSLFNCAKVLFTKRLPNQISFKDKYLCNPIAIGKSKHGIQYLPMNNHVLIGGISGSGKSNLMKLICLQAYLNGYELICLDYKRVELSIFKDVAIDYQYDSEAIDIALEQVYQNILNRFDIFDTNKVVDIKQYNELMNYNKMKYRLLLIDELAIMSKEGMKLLKKIICIARASGYIVILSIQRPSTNDNLNPTIKANIDIVISFKTATEKDSNIIGIPNANQINTVGRCFISSGGYINEVQTFYLDHTDIIKKVSDIKNSNSINSSDYNWKEVL